MGYYHGHRGNDGMSEFDDWMSYVDDAVYNATGLSVHDLPDCNYMDMFRDGANPENAAEAALRRAGFEGEL